MPSSLELAFLDETRHDEWDSLVRDAPEGCLFHTAKWTRLLAEPFGADARILAIIAGERVIGGCPVYVKGALGLSISNPPLLAGYAGAVLFEAGGSVAAEARRLEALRRLEGELRRRFAFTRMEHAPMLADPRAFLWGGWRVTPRFSFRIPLREPQRMLASFEGTVRTRVRKAEKGGLVIERVGDAGALLPLYAEAYHRHRLPSPVPEPQLRALLHGVFAAGLARAYVVRDGEGALHGFRIILLDGERAYDWIAGSDRAHLKGGGPSYLVWKILADLSESHREFDFMGANTRPVARFKLSFGGELIRYWVTERGTLPARALLTARRLVRAGLRSG